MQQLSLLIVAITLSPCAHAYIDPGTGSFMLQMLVASIIGAGITLKMYYHNFKAKLKSLFSRKPKDNDSEHEQQS